MGRSDMPPLLVEEGPGLHLSVPGALGGWVWAQTLAGGWRKVALWVSPSSCGQVILGLGAREMIPPEGQAWTGSGCLPCENAPLCSREERSGPA